MKRKFLLIPILLLLSCGKSTPTMTIDAGVCPVCVCEKISCAQASPDCTTQNIESCVENCFSENDCFFSFSPKSCFKKCSGICLNKFGCKWSK